MYETIIGNVRNSVSFQVLESIAPPYTPEFVQLFLPMVENEEITGTMSATGDCDLVSDFIGKSLIEAFL